MKIHFLKICHSCILQLTTAKIPAIILFHIFAVFCVFYIIFQKLIAKGWKRWREREGGGGLVGDEVCL